MADSDNSTKSLLLVSPGGLGPHYHGPAISLFRLLCGLRDKLRVDVVHGSAEQGGLEPLKGRAIRTGTKHASLLRSTSYMLASALHVIRHRHEYDAVLLATLNLLTLIPGAIAHVCGLRVIARAAAIAEVSTETGGGVGRWIKNSLMQRVSAYLAISDGIAEALEQTIRAEIPVHRIPNSVDISRFAPVTHSQARDTAVALGVTRPHALQLVNVGAVGARKGQHLIVEALAHLPQETGLLLVGPCREPDYWFRIERIIAEHGLADRVTYIPFIENIEKAYQAGEIFILPSYGEGMPNAMLEAMGCGLVPVGTNVSGIEDLVETDCGVFIARDPASIAQAVQSYLDYPEMLASHRDAARKKIEKSFSSQAIGNQVFDLLFHAGKSPAS